MASRTSAGSPTRAARPRTSGGGRRPTAGGGRPPTGASGRPGARRHPARRSRRRTGPGPVRRTFRALGRLVRAIYLGLAHLLGGLTRRVGRTARDGAAQIDSAQRRDGVGLLLVALAVLAAAATWWRIDGPVGSAGRSAAAG